MRFADTRRPISNDKALKVAGLVAAQPTTGRFIIPSSHWNREYAVFEEHITRDRKCKYVDGVNRPVYLYVWVRRGEERLINDWVRLLKKWWRRLDSNQRPTDYETVALTT